VFNGMGDSHPQELYRQLAERLNDFKLAYFHIIEPRISGADTVAEGQAPIAALDLSRHFCGKLIAAGGFTPETAEAAIPAEIHQSYRHRPILHVQPGSTVSDCTRSSAFSLTIEIRSKLLQPRAIRTFRRMRSLGPLVQPNSL
jgi:hypothetical protein